MPMMQLSLFGALLMAVPASEGRADLPVFRVPGQIDAATDEGTGTITLFVEQGTTLAGLAPSIGLPDGYTVSPGSGEPQDFSDGIAYVVRGEGRSREWRVDVLIKERTPVLDFDGRNTCVRTRIDMLKHVAAHEAFSLSLWFLPRDRERRQHLVSQGARFRIDYRPESDRLDFRFATDGYTTRTVSVDVEHVRFNRWNHLAISSRAPGITRMFLNGREVADTRSDVPYGDPEDSSTLVIGAHSSITRHFDGRLRDLRIYLGRALDEREVLGLYRGQEPGPAGLFAHWAMDEAEGDTALDKAGNDHHGTIVAAEWRQTLGVFDAAGEPSLAGLLVLLADMSDWRRFVAAAEALSEAGWEPGDDAHAARYWIARGDWQACAAIGEAAVVPLADALQAGPDLMRAEAAGLLAGIGGPVARQALLRAAVDDAPEVRRAVAEGLGQMGDRQALEGLLGLLDDGHREVRRAAVGELVRIGDAEHLLDRLHDESAVVRAAAADVLGRMGAPQAVSALRARLTDGEVRVRGRAATALGAILAGRGERAGDDVAHVVVGLGKLLDLPEVRSRAAAALGRIGGGQARSVLIEGGYPDAWPTWRYDSARTAFTPHELPRQLHLAWQRQLPAPKRAWPPQDDDADKLAFDVSYEPIAYGGMLYVPSMVRDRVTAYDAATGEEVWRFYTGGPVRFAPAAWQGRLYFVSDDGYLYCVRAADGELLWTFREAPAPRRILGNERLIDTWPARGAPVIHDGIVYFAAGIWPSMGVFIHAVEAETGKSVWTSSGSGTHFIPQIHQSGGSYSGPAPQGYLATAGDVLLAPGGRSRPAAFRRATGEFLYYNLVPRPWDRYPGMGGYAAMIVGDYFHVHGEFSRLADGELLLQVRTPYLEQLRAEDRPQYRRATQAIDRLPPGSISVANDQELVGALDGKVAGYAHQFEVERMLVTERSGEQKMVDQHMLQELWTVDAGPAVEHVSLQAGSRFYGSGRDGAVLSVAHPLGAAEEAARITRIGTVEGRPWSMLAAGGRLFVVTEQGRIYCFAGESAPARTHKELDSGLTERSGECADRAAAIVRSSGTEDGYAVVVGAVRADLTEELLRRTNLHIVVLAADAGRAAHLRRYFDDAGVYGSRVAVHAGDPLAEALPPYFADLIVVEDMSEAEGEMLLRRVFASLRPYGGTAFLAVPPGTDRQGTFSKWIEAAGLENAELTVLDNHVRLTRPGPLPGAGQWTHQNATSANTLFSPESRVRAPLGVLWFGGPTNEDVLPRHGRGPTPQVAGGRLFILGPDTLSARDVYTGRVLWTKPLPGIGTPYDTTAHQPGADHVGSPYVSQADAVYVCYEGSVLKLDPASGQLVRQFDPGGQPDEEEAVPLGYLGMWEDLLIVGAEAHYFDDSRPGHGRSWNATSSGRLVVMDRHTGKRLWQREAEYGFRHNAIATAAGRVFLVDRLSDGVLDLLARRGRQPDGTPQLMALDARTGEVLWSARQHVFGSWLGYSEEHDILLQGSRPPVDGRQALSDEPRPGTRLTAYRGRSGELLWEQGISYRNPCIIHGDKIIVYGEIYSLLTGEPYLHTHPVTGEEVPWTYAASSNCGQIIASEHLLTFRRGTASYYDLAGAGGTGDVGGVRAGCTPNMVAADGVLSVPDYTRTCVCQYPLQTSLALVPMSDAEQWMVDSVHPTGAAVKRIGTNFGARGHRMDSSGTLWMAYPQINLVGGTSEQVPLREQTQTVGSGTPEQILVQMTPEPPDWARFYQHSSLFEGHEPRWVAASGIEGAGSVELLLADDGQLRRYTVRLHFAEPGRAGPGERVFDVLLQGKAMLEGLDVAAEAGRARRGIVRQFDVEVRDRLHVELRAAPHSVHQPLLCGLEVVRDDPDAADGRSDESPTSGQR